MKANEVKSIVDFCRGHWIFRKDIDWNGAKYVGADILEDVIIKNRQRYTNEYTSFIHVSELTFELPPADLLICDDILHYLSNEDVIMFLKQLPKYKHCLLINDVNKTTLTSDNPKIYPGQYRLLDLTKPPFLVEGTKIFHYHSGGVTKQVLYIKNMMPQYG